MARPTIDPSKVANQKRDRMNRSIVSSILFTALLLAGCFGPRPVGTRGTVVHEVTEGRFDSYLQEMMKTEHFTGAVLIMRKGRIIHAKGYGAATVNSANHVDTKFHVGSITKQFTAAAIMQLVEKGVVKLDESINSYLPRNTGPRDGTRSPCIISYPIRAGFRIMGSKPS
jgi:CubicO group peptidase (beta-lactamase class C family)